jgi:hypothetical protein
VGPSIVPKVAIAPVFTAFTVCAVINFDVVVEQRAHAIAQYRIGGTEYRDQRPCRTIAALHSENAAGVRVHGSFVRASSIANRCLLK